MKSIFHLITTITRGGAENQLLLLVKEQVIQGFDVHVVYLKGEPELSNDFTLAGAQVHAEVSGVSPVMQPFKFRRLLRGKQVVVHAHLPRAELIALLTLANFRLIVSRHNSEPFFPGAPKIVSNFLSILVSIRASKIVAISYAVRDFLVSQGEVYSNEKIEVVLYGYKPYFSRREVSKNDSKEIVNIGTISRLTDQKNLPTMLRAFQEYNSSNQESKLSILGAGPLRNVLDDLTKELNISNSVRFCGRRAKVYDFLSELDVFILTSNYEGFGLVLLEAIDARVPIVASRNSAIPEVLGEDFPGLCATTDSSDFARKISLLEDPVYRHNILKTQEERLFMFDAEKMTARIISLY